MGVEEGSDGSGVQRFIDHHDRYDWQEIVEHRLNGGHADP